MPKFLRILTNRYVLVTVVVGVWMVFFDRYDFFTIMGLRAQTQTLYQDRAFYHAEIARLREQRDMLEYNADEIERIAREKYYMKKPNEDLYLIIDDSTEKD